MRFNSKVLQTLVLASLLLAGAGCSGINTSHSVSPATFLLPGLLQVEPPTPASPVPLPAAEQISQSR